MNYEKDKRILLDTMERMCEGKRGCAKCLFRYFDRANSRSICMYWIIRDRIEPEKEDK